MENTKKIIEAFFNSNDKIVYGFVVLQTFYENMCTIINESETLPHKIYPLLSSLNDSMQDVFNHIDLNYLCDNFRWFSFTQNVLTTSDLMPPNEKQMEIQALIQLNKLIGKKLANCNFDVKKRWYEYLEVFNDKDIEQEHQKVISRCVFSFLESQILFDNNNLVLSYFYDKLLKNETTVSECFIRVFLLTSCYLYYLGYREDERYVNNQDKDLRSRSKMIFDQSIDKLKRILETIAYRDVNLNSGAPYNIINIFNTTLLSFMKDSLCLCEFISEEFKTVIMGNVVDEFVLHSLVFMKCETILNIAAKKIMNNEQVKSLLLMPRTNDKFNQSHELFLKIFNSNQYEMTYNLFIKELENLYKQNLFEEERQSIKENYQNISYKNIEEKILRRIRDVFNSCENDICSNYKTTTLLSIRSIPNCKEQGCLFESFIDVDCILGNIVITLFNRMTKNNEATLFIPSILINENILENSKKDDESLLRLIEKHKGHIYIGGDGLLLPNNICFYSERYDKAIKELSKKCDVGGPWGIFIDSARVKIFVKNIKISRGAQTIQDSEAIEINGMYKYKLNGIETTCTKEELEEYLQLNESVLSISADVGYDIESETKVDFIYMRM